MSAMPTTITATNEISTAISQVSYQRNIAGRAAALKAADSNLLRTVLQAAYNPYIRFGVKLTPALEQDLRRVSCEPVYHAKFGWQYPGIGIEDPDVWKLIDQLQTTTGASSDKYDQCRALAHRMARPAADIFIGILKKSLTSGLGVSAINKAFPDFIPTFNVQLAHKYTDRKVKSFPVYVEPKYDGMRAIAVVTGSGEVTVTSRSGRDIPAAKFFHKELAAFGLRAIEQFTIDGFATTGVVIDGEIIGDSFKNTMEQFRADATAKSGNFKVFDLLPLQAITDKAFVSEEYTARRVRLMNLFKRVYANVSVSPNYLANSKAELWDMYTKARAQGLEGIIVKAANGKWCGKRSNDWLKVKAEETADLRIIGAFEGQGEMEGTLGGLIVEYPYKPGKFTEVRVGSGFTHSERAKIWGWFLEDIAKIAEGEDDYNIIGKLVEVQYQEVTPDHSLRHPVFVQLRFDKDEVSF